MWCAEPGVLIVRSTTICLVAILVGSFWVSSCDQTHSALPRSRDWRCPEGTLISIIVGCQGPVEEGPKAGEGNRAQSSGQASRARPE